MTGIQLYEDETEKIQHFHAIQMLVKDLKSSQEEISTLYEIELERLKLHARVKDFLTVLVSRRVKEILLGR
jgi:hypothetical protein